MTGFIEGESRAQATFFPVRLDDYIAEERPTITTAAFTAVSASLRTCTISARPSFIPLHQAASRKRR